MSHKIEVVPYDPHWPQMFEEEAKKIKQVLGENCSVVHHVGSTAVSGLAAKPQIDIIVAVKDFESALPSLANAGYIEKGEFNLPFHMIYGEQAGHTRANIHVFEEGNPEIELNLLFRDYLRNHPKAREEYTTLKYTLIKHKERNDVEKHGLRVYTLGKDAFIRKILLKAGFNGLCMRSSAHHDEWKIVRAWRQKFFFDKIPIADPYTWTFNHKDHLHLIFYKGTKIIGYAHIQLWPDHRAALRIIVIEENFRGHGLGGKFLKLC